MSEKTTLLSEAETEAQQHADQVVDQAPGGSETIGARGHGAPWMEEQAG